MFCMTCVGQGQEPGLQSWELNHLVGEVKADEDQGWTGIDTIPFHKQRTDTPLPQARLTRYSSFSAVKTCPSQKRYISFKVKCVVLSHKRLFWHPNTWQLFGPPTRICASLHTLDPHMSVWTPVSSCSAKVNLKQELFSPPAHKNKTHLQL